MLFLSVSLIAPVLLFSSHNITTFTYLPKKDSSIVYNLQLYQGVEIVITSVASEYNDIPLD